MLQFGDGAAGCAVLKGRSNSPWGDRRFPRGALRNHWCRACHRIRTRRDRHPRKWPGGTCRYRCRHLCRTPRSRGNRSTSFRAPNTEDWRIRHMFLRCPRHLRFHRYPRLRRSPLYRPRPRFPPHLRSPARRHSTSPRTTTRIRKRAGRGASDLWRTKRPPLHRTARFSHASSFGTPSSRMGKHGPRQRYPIASRSMKFEGKRALAMTSGWDAAAAEAMRGRWSVYPPVPSAGAAVRNAARHRSGAWTTQITELDHLGLSKIAAMGLFQSTLAQ